MTEKNSNNIIPMKGGKCPMCNKPWNQIYRPFCSKRCADLDLSKWLNEVYRVPINETSEFDDDAFLDNC